MTYQKMARQCHIRLYQDLKKPIYNRRTIGQVAREALRQLALLSRLFCKFPIVRRRHRLRVRHKDAVIRFDRSTRNSR